MCDNFRPPFLLFLACNQRGSPQRSPDGVGTAEGERTNYGDRTCHPKSRRRQAMGGGKERGNKNTCGQTLFVGNERISHTYQIFYRKVRGNKKSLLTFPLLLQSGIKVIRVLTPKFQSTVTKVPEIDTVPPPPLGHAPSIPGVSRGGGVNFGRRTGTKIPLSLASVGKKGNRGGKV